METKGVGKVYTCANVPWYKFRHCTLATCKHQSDAVKSGCLKIDRVEPEGNKPYTDAELRLFKNPDVTTRNIGILRKKSCERVKSILSLYAFIRWIKSNVRLEDPIVTTQTQHYMNRLPFRLKQLEFDETLWPHVVDQGLYEKFLKEAGSECRTIPLCKALFIDEEKLESLRTEIVNFVKENAHV